MKLTKQWMKDFLDAEKFAATAQDYVQPEPKLVKGVICSQEKCYQDYSGSDCGIPSHWVVIYRVTGEPFAFHFYADTEAACDAWIAQYDGKLLSDLDEGDK